MHWPLCVVDTETTGLPGDPLARVCEIGAVVVDASGRELGAFSTLVNPGALHDQAAGALVVSGITEAELAAAPAPKLAGAALLAWYQAHRRPWVTSWRRAFDEELLERSIDAAPLLRWSSCLWAESRSRAAQLRLLGVPTDPTRRPRWPALRDLAEALDLEVGVRHRALEDARLAARVAVSLFGSPS